MALTITGSVTSGGFNAKTDYTTGYSPASVAIADVNGRAGSGK